MGLKVITPRSAPALALADAKLHLKVDVSADDAYITSLIAVAAEVVQHRTRTAIGAQTLEQALDSFPSGSIELTLGPVSSITTIKYLDPAGALQTLDSAWYVLDEYSEVPWADLASGLAWPATRAVPNAVLVRYVAGAAAIPDPARQAMLLLIGHWYENRMAVVAGSLPQEVPLGVSALLAPITRWEF